MPFMEKMTLGPYRERMTLKKWPDGADPKIDQPEEEITISTWYDENNNQITDEDRIQTLELSLDISERHQEENVFRG